MHRDVDGLRHRTFDVLVVGGGINGTGVARDAARRGLSVALVEQRDLGYGTTSRSTRLIHGGLRYLALYDFGLVRESLKERERLLRNAPHLVRPIKFLIPIYEGQKPSGAKLRIGVTLYDLLSYDKSLPNHTWLDRDEALAAEPGLNPVGLQGALTYHDAQVSYVERLCVENALDAAAHGATVANHAEAVDLLMDGDTVTGCRVRDVLTGETFDVHAKVVVNAAGPWLDALLPGTDRGRSPVRMTKGIHLFMPRHTENAIVLFSPEDDRLFFDIPWHGHSMVGTTDTDLQEALDEVRAVPEEVQYLLRALKRVFPRAPTRVDWTYAGVRSLLNVEGVSEGEVTRRHLVLDHAEVDGTRGLVAVVGGKITPYRLVCEETVDVVAAKLGVHRASDTASSPLPGAPAAPLASYAERHVHTDVLREDVTRHLVDLYGARQDDVVALARAHAPFAERVCEHGPDIWAQVRFAVDREMAVTLEDVLLRRTTIGHAECRGEHVAEDVARSMAPLLGWNDDRVKAEVRRYAKEVSLRAAFPGKAP